jgi:hypothetical protein
MTNMIIQITSRITPIQKMMFAMVTNGPTSGINMSNKPTTMRIMAAINSDS